MEAASGTATVFAFITLCDVGDFPRSLLGDLLLRFRCFLGRFLGRRLLLRSGLLWCRLGLLGLRRLLGGLLLGRRFLLGGLGLLWLGGLLRLGRLLGHLEGAV